MTHVSHCVDSYIEKKGCVRVLSVILSWSILYATVQVIMLELIIFVVAYLLGSVPFGKIIAWKWYHVDIQKRGSGNIGFANMLGILGWKAAVPTLVGDVSKGAAAALIAQHYAPELAFWAGLVAMLAHIFPVWLGFRGGKGIATAFGMLLVIAPYAALVGFAIYMVPYMGLKIESGRAAIVALIVLTAVGPFLTSLAWWHFALLLAIASYTLRDNICGTIPRM